MLSRLGISPVRQCAQYNHQALCAIHCGMLWVRAYRKMNTQKSSAPATRRERSPQKPQPRLRRWADPPASAKRQRNGLKTTHEQLHAIETEQGAVGGLFNDAERENFHLLCLGCCGPCRRLKAHLNRLLELRLLLGVHAVATRLR